MSESPKESNIKKIAVLGVDVLTHKAVVIVREGERLVPNPLRCIRHAGRASFTGTVEQLDQESLSPEQPESPPDV